MTDVASDADQIRLSLPARHEYARIARIAVTALALRLGFTYREVEDLLRVGAYERGQDAFTDRALAAHAPLTGFLRQSVDEPTDPDPAATLRQVLQQVK